MTPLLTIVIPTFNRPDHLQNLVALLLPQRDPRWKLVIVDNHSPIPVRDLVPADVTVLRNPVNILSAGNFPRCFEIMDTDWVWMIGDDDLVDADAIDHVLEMIGRYPEAAIINFGAHGHTDDRKEALVCQGFDGFLAGTDSITKAVWMSGNVYSRRHYWPHVGMAYLYANTSSGHFVLLMMVLLKGGTFVQLPRAVCRQSENTPENNHGELIGVVMALADIPMTKTQRHEFTRLLQKEFTNFSRDLVQCAFQMENLEARDDTLFMYTTRWARWSIARGSVLMFLTAFGGRLMLKYKLGRMLIRAAVRLKEVSTGRLTIRRPYVPRAGS